jgi:hypothetical protein
MDKRVFKTREVEPNGTGWIADLNNPESKTINPDCYWHFKTRKTAARFLQLVDGGMEPHQAVAELERKSSGTAPDTSLYLGQERRAWLAEQGGIQPTIQRLIDEAKMDYSKLASRLLDLGFRPDEIDTITDWWAWREHYDWLMTASRDEIAEASREAFGE